MTESPLPLTIPNEVFRGMGKAAADDDNRFGLWLRDRLADRGYKQTSLASYVGVEPQAVNAWVHGRRKPLEREYIIKLAEALGVTTAFIADLVIGNGSPNAPDSLNVGANTTLNVSGYSLFVDEDMAGVLKSLSRLRRPGGEMPDNGESRSHAGTAPDQRDAGDYPKNVPLLENEVWAEVRPGHWTKQNIKSGARVKATIDDISDYDYRLLRKFGVVYDRDGNILPPLSDDVQVVAQDTSARD